MGLFSSCSCGRHDSQADHDNEGRIVEIANSDDIYRNPREAYTRRLLASIPKGWQGGRASSAAAGNAD